MALLMCIRSESISCSETTGTVVPDDPISGKVTKTVLYDMQDSILLPKALLDA